MNAKRIRLILVAACLTLGAAQEASAYYAAHLGRFTSRDPAGEIGRHGAEMPSDTGMATGFVERDQFDPMAGYRDGMNLYQYVKSSPTGNTDPTGLYLWGGVGTPIQDEEEPSEGPNLYCYYITPGNSAPADPWYLNWGSETGFVVGGIAGGAAAAGPTVTIKTGGCFTVWCKRLQMGFRRDPAHHGKPHGHWHWPWNW